MSEQKSLANLLTYEFVQQQYLELDDKIFGFYQNSGLFSEIEYDIRSKNGDPELSNGRLPFEKTEEGFKVFLAKLEETRGRFYDLPIGRLYSRLAEQIITALGEDIRQTHEYADSYADHKDIQSGFADAVFDSKMIDIVRKLSRSRNGQ